MQLDLGANLIFSLRKRDTGCLVAIPLLFCVRLRLVTVPISQNECWFQGEDVSVESFDEWSSAEEHVTATASGGQGVVTETAVGDGAVTSTRSKRRRGLDTVDMSTVDTDKNNPVVGNMATEVRETLREDVE